MPSRGELESQGAIFTEDSERRSSYTGPSLKKLSAAKKRTHSPSLQGDDEKGSISYSEGNEPSEEFQRGFLFSLFQSIMMMDAKVQKNKKHNLKKKNPRDI